MKMKTNLPTLFAKVLLVSALVASAANGWAALTLGAAAPYAVFQLGGGGNFNISDAFINGDVAFGPGNYNTSLGGNFGVNGNIYDSGNRSILVPANAVGWDISDPLGSNPTTFPFTGTIFHNVDLTQAVADARAASTTALGLPPDFNLGAVGGPQTIALNSVMPITPGVYVIDATTFHLSSGMFVLDGTGIPTGSQVIINVTGQFSLTGGGSITLAGGLTANQVLVNNTTTQAASITGASILQGSFLGPNLNAQFNNNAAAVYGQVIAQSIQFSSHFRVYGELFVPEPATFAAAALLLIPLAASALRMRRKSN